jgi:hypothetical protein
LQLGARIGARHAGTTARSEIADDQPVASPKNSFAGAPDATSKPAARIDFDALDGGHAAHCRRAIGQRERIALRRA